MKPFPKSEAMANRIYPQTETERLCLRMFRFGDLEDAYLLFNDSEVQKYLSPQNKRTREQLKTLFEKCLKYWEKRGFGVWCVTEKNIGKMIGYCGFQYFDKTEDVELVFGFTKECWGKGFASESAEASLKYGFEKLSLKKILAATNPQNIASRRVLEKLRMSVSEEGSHYEMNTVTYSITQNEYQKHTNFCEKRRL